MLLTEHWEWRGFGRVSSRFVRRFEALSSSLFDQTQRIVDEYLWIPDVHVNLKFRQGAGVQDGLKFKRLIQTRGDFERWKESIAEVFPFPLSAEAWRSLLAEMKSDAIPPEGASRAEAVRFLKSIDPRIRTVVVQKERRSRRSGPNDGVKVELAQILTPTKTASVGLESEVISLLKDALVELRLHEEALETMNYLDYMRRCAGK